MEGGDKIFIRMEGGGRERDPIPWLRRYLGVGGGQVSAVGTNNKRLLLSSKYTVPILFYLLIYF